MNKKFYNSDEYQQSLRMQPACNMVLSKYFDVPSEKIVRIKEGDHDFILDQKFHIDLKVILNNGSQLTGQEKSLSNHFYSYRTFTMEFYQNRYTKEPGEFFKIASQFYLHGYSDESGIDFIEWKIYHTFNLIEWLKDFCVEKLEKKTRPAKGSNASFLPIPYKSIPESILIAQGTRVNNDMKINITPKQLELSFL